jgi:hypothetical protein
VDLPGLRPAAATAATDDRQWSAAMNRSAVMARIRVRLERDFPIGCRVQLSALGRARQVVPKKHLDRHGTVVAYSHGVSPAVRWDGLKGAKGYAHEFLQRSL